MTDILFLYVNIPAFQIGDFGLAVSATSIQTKTAADIVGTCSHIPPEIWEETIQKPDELCDVFT